VVDVLMGTPLVVITFEGEHVFEVNVLMGMLALLSNGYIRLFACRLCAQNGKQTT